MRFATVAAVLFLVAACGGSVSSPSGPIDSSAAGSQRNGCVGDWPTAGTAKSTGPIPLLVNSDLAPGDNRLLLSLIDADGFPVGGPAWRLSAESFNLTADGCTPLATKIDLPFSWSIKDLRGFFIGPANIPAGTEELGLAISGTDANGAVFASRSGPAFPTCLRKGRRFGISRAPRSADNFSVSLPSGCAGPSDRTVGETPNAAGATSCG
mgnify:CR=1 FL=1